MVTTADGAALARIDDHGKIQQQVANAERGMIFVPAPGGEQVAYVPIGARVFGNLHLVGSDGSGKREIETGPALAALWSPDGQSIAYITFASDEEFKTTSTRSQEAPTLEWHILDVATGHSRALTRFVPSEEFFNLLPFFDQYAQSIRLWDTMSRRLVYADNAGVWTLDVQTGEVTNVAPGVIGLWLER